MLGRQASADEIDFDGGVILLPQCISVGETVQALTEASSASMQPQVAQPPPTPMPQAASAPISTSQSIESLTIEMHLTKNLLYKTFNVLGLLADKAGQIKITIEAEGLSGLDPIWVRNAIKEPLSEANVPFQIRESNP